MAELHSRRGRPRKDGRTPKPAFVKYQEPVPQVGSLSGEDALRLLSDAEGAEERAQAVERICRQVASSGARPS